MFVQWTAISLGSLIFPNNPTNVTGMLTNMAETLTYEMNRPDDPKKFENRLRSVTYFRQTSRGFPFQPNPQELQFQLAMLGDFGNLDKYYKNAPVLV